MSNTSAEITRWLKAWGRGEDAALDRLTPLVYDELRRRARAYIRHETPGHTLQPTALVNEAFLHLVDAGDVDWHDRAHFFAVAARIMRRILVDAARARGTLKRGGGAERSAHFPAVDLDGLPAVASDLAERAVRAGRCAGSVGEDGPPAGSGRRPALLRWADDRRNGAGARHLGSNGDARLETRSSLARA